MKNKSIILILTFGFFLGNRFSFAAENAIDPREAAIDRAIGGMVEGSRPLPPQSYAGKNHARAVPGGGLSPGMDTRVTASASSQNASGQATASSGANLGESTTGETGANLGGTTHEETTGGHLEGNAGGGTTEPSTEPTGGGSSNDSIVSADANVDLSGSSPTVDANLDVDTNAGNLVDADVGAATDTTSSDVLVTESGDIAGHELNTAVNEAPVDATLDAEVAATDIPAESEATAGLEADIDPVTADSDGPASDPANGLSSANLL